MLGSCREATQLVGSREVLISIELVSYCVFFVGSKEYIASRSVNCCVVVVIRPC
jgi:hypothetical protein